MMQRFPYKHFFTTRFLKSALGGISWLTLMCSRFLIMLGEEENRLCYFWTGWDSAVLFGGIALAGIVLSMFWTVATHLLDERWNRHLRGMAVFLACLGIIQLLPVQGAAWLLWCVLVAGLLLGLCVSRGIGAVWEWSGIVLLSLFPLYGLFVVQSFRWESFAEAAGPGTLASGGLSATAESPSVFLVLYDSVGAEDVYTTEGGWKEKYPAFAAFGKECVTFANAKSPGRHTALSIPGLVLQRPIEEDQSAPWRYWREINQSDSWLLLSKRAGHVRTLIGDYLPWGMLLRELPDYMNVRPYNGWDGLSGWWGRPIRDVLFALDSIHAPWGRFWKAIPKVKWWAVTADINYRHDGKQRQWAEFRKLSEEGPSRGQTILFHSNLTHDSDYLEDGTLDPTRGTPESELTYVDREFGKWVAEMKKLGRWDDCWVMLTADHSKGQGRRHRHVPFAVKAPDGIGGGTWVEGTLPLWQLTPFLESVYSDAPSEASLLILTNLPGK